MPVSSVGGLRYGAIVTEVLPPRGPSGVRPIEVRVATRADLADPAVAGSAHEYATELTSWIDAMDRGDAAVFVALYEGALAGRVTLSTRDERRAWISSLMVDAAWRRRGVARALMLHAQQHAAALGYREIRLAVGITNTPAELLYRDLGYTAAGTRRTQGLRGDAGEWIHRPEDAWELRLPLAR